LDDLKENNKSYNRHTNKEFENQINRYFSNPSATHSVLSLGETPPILQLCGAKGDRVVIPVSIINDKCTAKKKTKKNPHPHNLSKNLMRSLPNLIRTPVMVFKGSHPNTLAIICNATDRKKDFILVSCLLNANGRNTRINNVVTSAYGKNKVQNYINNHINDLIAYNSQFQIEKTGENSYSTLRLQLPLGRNIICFDNSISYSTDSVKGFDKKSLENIQTNLEKRFSETNGRRNKEVHMEEQRLSAIIKHSVEEATAPVVKRVDEVADKIETLANRVNEQDVLISELANDNNAKTQIIAEQKEVITEQQETIESLKAQLEKALKENEQLKAEKAVTQEILTNVSDKLSIAVPKFERKDYASQYEEIGALLDMVAFVPENEVYEQKIENSELKTEIAESKKTLFDVRAELKSVQNENSNLRSEIDRLKSRAEKVMTAEIDKPTKAERVEQDRQDESPGKEEPTQGSKVRSER
jgi:uncharacterized protein YlxP (DUF503 family)